MGYCHLTTGKKTSKKYGHMDYKKSNFSNEDSIYNLVRYVMTDKRTGEHVQFGAVRGVPEDDVCAIVHGMKYVKARYGKSDKVQMHHFILSFGNISDVEEVYNVGIEIMDEMFYGYQVAFGVHEDTEHLHIHFAVNSVSMLTGKKWHKNREEFRIFKDEIEKMADEHFGIRDGCYYEPVEMEELL